MTQSIRVATVPDTDHHNQSKKITTNEASDIRNLASDKQVIHQKMQLWTNKEENEYAIRLILSNNDSRFARVGEKKVETNLSHRQTLDRNTLILSQKLITLWISNMAGIMH